MTRLVVVLAALLLGLSAAHAQEPAAQVEVEPFVGLTVGDPVSIRVTISHDAGESVVLDDSLVDMGGMEPSAPVIREISEMQTLIVFGTRSFSTGTFEVTLPPISVRRLDGSLNAVALSPVLVSIGSVLADDAQPRPNTAPDLLEAEDRTFTPWIVAIIGIGLGFVVARIARGRIRTASPAESQVGQAAEARPMVTFELDESLDAAEQCRRLSASVRSRLGDDWSLPADALTASEIGPALAAAGAPGVVILRVTRLIEACDRVQFGGEQPTPERLRGYRQLAEAIWEDGTP